MTKTLPQLARAAHLRELFEPWSLRRLEARTGIGRGTLQGRFNGTRALTMSDIEVLAPVIRMKPEELFAELLAVRPGKGNGLASEEARPALLPHLDSNQEPIG
jgi:transcriptional regulator with XRE-family HTH domain